MALTAIDRCLIVAWRHAICYIKYPLGFCDSIILQFRKKSIEYTPFQLLNTPILASSLVYCYFYYKSRLAVVCCTSNTTIGFSEIKCSYLCDRICSSYYYSVCVVCLAQSWICAMQSYIHDIHWNCIKLSRTAHLLSSVKLNRLLGTIQNEKTPLMAAATGKITHVNIMLQMNWICIRTVHLWFERVYSFICGLLWVSAVSGMVFVLEIIIGNWLIRKEMESS